MHLRMIIQKTKAKVRRKFWWGVGLWTMGLGMLWLAAIRSTGKFTPSSNPPSFIERPEILLTGCLILLWIVGILGWIAAYKQIKRHASKRASLIEQLKISRDWRRFWANSVSEGLLLYDGQTIITANAPLAKMTGCRRNELMGKSIWSLWAPEHHDKIREQFLKQNENEFDATIIQKDGTPLPVKMQIQVKDHPSQNKKIGVVFVQNLTKIQKAQIAVKENERKLFTLISNLPGMAYRCQNDPSWTMEYISDVCQEITGYRSDELVSNQIVAFGDLIHPGDRERVNQTVQQAIQDKIPFEMAYRITTASNEEKWLWEKGRGVYNAKGELISLEGFILDISDRKSLEEQFYQAQKMESIGRMAGGIAHDFNNLLTVITGYCNLSLMKLKNDDPLYKNIEQIFQAADQAAAITSQLLAFSRKQVFQPKILDLNSVLSDMQKMIQRLIGEDIELKTDFDPHLWNIKSDVSQIQQIIINLAVNARDAMPYGGRIIIQTYNCKCSQPIVQANGETPKPTEDDSVVIAFSDTGCGIDPKIIPQIFEPMFTTKEPGKGTGLGLSTVYGIVKQNNGRIEVQSEPGKGTLFRLFFPAVEETDEEDAVYPPPAHNHHHNGAETILVIDDNPTIRLLIKKILDESTYTVMEATNEEAALHISQETSPIHLLITDLVMPKMSGKMLADRIQSLHPSIKVLFISGYDNVGFEHSEAENRHFAFLAKPFNAETLREKIYALLNTP
ncbi:MAG: PAS domain S-box protein [Candidatus Hinthialibacter sp.]